VSTDDIGVIGPFALLVLSMYFGACQASVRREVVDLIDPRMTSESAEKAYLSVRAGMVLNSSEDFPAVINKQQQSRRRGVFGVKTGRLYRLLVFLPALASVAAVVQDFYGAYIEIAPRPPSGHLSAVIRSIQFNDSHTRPIDSSSVRPLGFCNDCSNTQILTRCVA
jgi:hypothetical protein